MEYSLSSNIQAKVDDIETKPLTQDQTIMPHVFPWADYAFNTLLIILDNRKHRNLPYYNPNTIY